MEPESSKNPFPNGNLYSTQIFDLLGTFRVAAAQQILNTMSLNKPRHHTHRGFRFMRHNRIRAVFLGSALVAATALTAAPATAQTPYDGLWSVTIVTKTGTCEPTASSTMTVTDGKVSAAGEDVTGSIGREGLVRVSIHGAYANGQLSGNAGSGKWNGASAGIPCSGRWEASKR
jgi:hypothetical protein